jgi:hypothetical protein
MYDRGRAVSSEASMPSGVNRGALMRRSLALALMPAAAFAVHQLRYWLAFGGHAGVQLQAQGHSYLHSLVPWIVLLIAIAVGGFLRVLGRALGGRRSLARYTASFAALWLLCAVSLVAIYVCQEFLEALFVTGHPSGLAGMFGYGGWWCVPAAMGVGLVLAAIFHGARWVLHEVADRSRRTVPVSPRCTAPARPPGAVWIPRPAPLAGGRSGRGPPP